jgi:Circadian oscillating protein COP23
MKSLKSSLSIANVAVSLLKVTSFPFSIGIVLLAIGQNTLASPAPNYDANPLESAIQLVSEEVERSRGNRNDEESDEVPDVIIDDGDRSDDTTSSDPDSEDETSTSSDPDSEDEASTTTSTEPRFTCELNNGEHTVMYHPESRPGEAYAWAIPRQMGGGWSAERRCTEISRRLESYRPDGLQEMSTAVENNYNTVCVTTQKDPSCRIVFTVPNGQDPVGTRDRVFQNLSVADSGEQTQGVNTFVSNGRSNRGAGQIGQLGGDLGQLGQILNQTLSSIGTSSQSSNDINLRPFLDPADGGTGTKLQGSPFKNTNSNSLRLKPDNFR